MREAFIEAKNFIKSAPEITFWGGQRFLDRHDIHIHDYFFDDYSGYGLGVYNIDFGFGKLNLSYLGGIKDDINHGTALMTPSMIRCTVAFICIFQRPAESEHRRYSRRQMGYYLSASVWLARLLAGRCDLRYRRF
jgi:hypothetical protein